MSSIGYPDYFRPRDYLAGLEGAEMYVNWAVTAPSAANVVYTVPAGKTLVLRLIGNTVAAHVAAGAGAPGSLSTVVIITRGLDGASSAIYLAWAEVMLSPGQAGSQNVTIAETIAIKGGAADNKIEVQNILSGIDTWDGMCYLLGSVLD